MAESFVQSPPGIKGSPAADDASRATPAAHPVSRKQAAIALFTAACLVAHLGLRWSGGGAAATAGLPRQDWPLIAALALGGLPLTLDLLRKLLRREFGSDLLAGISIITSVLLGEHLAGALVVLMLSGGEALEAYAVRGASSVLTALVRRMPSRAHRRQDGTIADVALSAVAVGDTLVVFPHETCPVDGTVLEGHGAMDESYLTGEPYVMSKTPGSSVISGAINGEAALVIRAEKVAVDSRYARILHVLRAAEVQRPRLRRLGDQLGAFYTPLALAIALAAWMASGDSLRFLSVLVVATPCPLLIAIPVAIIGTISLAAKRAIIIKDPAVLENIVTCRTAIFDKTGTLTYGKPQLTEVQAAPEVAELELLRLVAALERYSKHPLAAAIVAAAAARGLAPPQAEEISERPGEGLRGRVEGKLVKVTSRKKLIDGGELAAADLPEPGGGLECVVLIDGSYAATLRFRDQPRSDSASFIHHLGPRHHFERMMLVSGDRESEVRYLAERVGVDEIHFGQSPEQKLELVRAETRRARTVFLGDGINDAPALTAATVGIAFGGHSDITTEAAGAVILESSLLKVDELLHIGRRLRTIALQSAVGGMAASVAGMLFASAGLLPPVAGALLQEGIDVVVVVNALRAAWPPRRLTDC